MGPHICEAGAKRGNEDSVRMRLPPPRTLPHRRCVKGTSAVEVMYPNFHRSKPQHDAMILVLRAFAIAVCVMRSHVIAFKELCMFFELSLNTMETLRHNLNLEGPPCERWHLCGAQLQLRDALVKPTNLCTHLRHEFGLQARMFNACVIMRLRRALFGRIVPLVVEAGVPVLNYVLLVRLRRRTQPRHIWA